MDVQSKLDRLRTSAEGQGGDLAAYTDLSAGLVLSWSSAAACPREALDSLGARTAACFALAQTITPEPAPRTALHFTARRTEVYGRADVLTEDAICLAAPAGSDAAALLSLMDTEVLTAQGEGT